MAFSQGPLLCGLYAGGFRFQCHDCRLLIRLQDTVTSPKFLDVAHDLLRQPLVAHTLAQDVVPENHARERSLSNEYILLHTAFLTCVPAAHRDDSSSLVVLDAGLCPALPSCAFTDS